MNFEDEDYVRYYTRDTVSWRALGWEGQCVMALMLHGKFDRSGVFDCDSHEPGDAVALVTGLPPDVVTRGLERLLKAGTWVSSHGKLVWPKFVHAQSCKRSDRLRKQESREKRRDDFLQKQGELPGLVTDGHSESQNVTPSLAYPKPKPSLTSTSDQGQTPVRSRSEEIKVIFDFWQKTMKHPNAKFDKSRKSKINQRLDDGFSVHDLNLAIHGASKDDFLMGRDPRNNGKKYDDFKTIFRDAAQVERLIELSGQKRGADGRSFTQDPEQALKNQSDLQAAIELERQLKLKRLRESVGSSESLPGKSLTELIQGAIV